MVAIVNVDKECAINGIGKCIGNMIAEKNREQILAGLASMKAQGIICDYGNVYTDSKGFHFSVQPFYPIFPYFKFDVAI